MTTVRRYHSGATNRGGSGKTLLVLDTDGKPMKPPICYVCDRRFDPNEEGNLLPIDPNKSTRSAPRELPPGTSGHPPNTQWFCGDHVEAQRTRLEEKRRL